LVWVRELLIRDLRNIREAAVELHPGLNVFLGANAQGKTSLLEAMGLLARGRSFRTEDTVSLVRRGSSRLRTRGRVQTNDRQTMLEVEIGSDGRAYRVDGREVRPSDYRGRLEAIVYSTDRLRVVRGSMRERREYVDRGGSALWPAYAQATRDFERVHRQRNAALEKRSCDLAAWDERFVAQGAQMRARRADYVQRLAAELPKVFHPRGEVYGIGLPAEACGPEPELRLRLEEALASGRAREALAGRCLFGPHRDPVALTIDGREAAVDASAGQARSLLLALSLAALAVFRQERGRSAVALLDDLDSELDEERAGALCAEVAGTGQALVTTAHPGWAERVRHLGRLYHVSAGEVRCAS
jgi:DNA replication and repair protein RecF